MKRISSILVKIELWIAALTMLGFTACIFIGAVSRAIGYPLGWTADIGLFLLAWSTFLAADFAFRDGRLVNLDLLVRRLPEVVRKPIELLMNVIIALFLVALIVYGIQLTSTTGYRTFNGVAGFSYSWLTICIPICSLFMLTTAIGRIVKLFVKTAPKQAESNETS